MSAICSLPQDAAQLRSRLVAAADYGREKIAETRSPCSRDLAWYLIQLGRMADELTPEQLDREARTAEHLWRAALEVERFERRWGGEGAP